MNGCLQSGARLFAAVLVVAVGLVGSGAGAAAPDGDRPRVLVTTLATPITPVVADHVEDGLRDAAEGGYAAYVIELDTPGGLVDAMRDIVADILASPVPVVVHVAPDGARAASAGAVITLAAHVAVMAPGTTIGAATPVGLEGEEVSDKIVNDLAAQAESLAKLRGRDLEFASSMVRDGHAVDVDTAVAEGVVDARAGSLTDALAAADGQQVAVADERTVVVRTAGAAVDRHELGAFRTLLQFLADPNLAFLLLTLGTLGLIYELATPGVGFAGATGVTCLLLALFSLSVLPVNAVGLLLLAVAAALFAAEVLAPGLAGFGFGGAVVLVLSAVFLFDDAEGVSVDVWAAIPLAVLMFVLVVGAGRVAMRTRRAPSVSTGTDVLIGRLVPVRTSDGTTGSTFTAGAWWSLRSTGRPLRTGSEARVVGVDGLVLLVDPDGNEDEAPAAPERDAEDEERGAS
ncbi:NfeD family protein [Nocardioides antri]|uniref:Nodulation protein NfeD n=1 Tax=Nocardioides antri TaxID=2607659 RepID=A0A5B1M7H6_9ACTN|nr:NfeD family protein [Nocardioides antri]KAA1428962.1 nodulation protein NfeD [Nocardioides antri]